MAKIKGAKPFRGHIETHTEPTKYGMGDYYGTGIRNKLGRMRDGTGIGFNPVDPKKLKKTPKSLA